MRNSRKETVTLLILGIFMGWVMAALTVTQTPWLTLSMAQGSEINNTSPVPNLPLKLNFLLSEHGENIIEISRAKYEGADLQKPSEALEANNTALANLASKLYGEKGRGVFLQLWKEHNLEIINYAEGVKLDDQIKQQKARQSLENITGQMKDTIKSSNLDYPADELMGLINDHIKITLETIDMFSQKDKSPSDIEKNIQTLSDQAEKISGFLVKNF